MFPFKSFAPRFLLATLLVLGLAVAGPSCSGGDDPKDEGKGGEGGTGPVAEVCGNDLDDDENGLTDCEDATCERTELCCPECFTQCGELGQAVCHGMTTGTASMICSPAGVCERSGEVDADGTVRRGEAMVMSKMAEINASMDYRAEQLLVISSIRPNTTEPATCDAIMARELDPTDPRQVNVVYKSNHPVLSEGDYIPAAAFGVPLPREGQKLLAVVRFFVARDSAANPVGDIVGEGGPGFDSMPEGRYEGHEEEPGRKWEVVIRLFCGGYLDRQCPDPKTCTFGLCRDTRCGTCGPGQTCREWNGVPECRKTCVPDAPDCPNLNRCDATPGEPAVCVPAA